MKIKAGIIGVTGYTGEELASLLVAHPCVELVLATSESRKGERLADLFPRVTFKRKIRVTSLFERMNPIPDVVFFCLPAGEAARHAARFLDCQCKIIDLGADFRFHDPSEFAKWYKVEHPRPDLLIETVYGLPEIHREQIQKAHIVGNPGCYPTSILLAVAPFIKFGLVFGEDILADCKSGLSGAGKRPALRSLFPEANENCSAYLPGRLHRHVGELEQELAFLSDQPFQILFTPHLVPMSRGILSTIYLKLNKECTDREVLTFLNRFYANEPFVKVLSDTIPETKMVLRSNFCFLHAAVTHQPDYVIVFSAIDNLGKGASWQAVQNMNLLFGLDETTGLLPC